MALNKQDSTQAVLVAYTALSIVPQTLSGKSSIIQSVFQPLIYNKTTLISTYPSIITHVFIHTSAIHFLSSSWTILSTAIHLNLGAAKTSLLMLGGALSGLTTHIIARLIFSTKSVTRTIVSSSSVTINSNYNIRDRINAYVPEYITTTINQAAEYSKKNIVNPVFGEDNIEKITDLKNDAYSNFTGYIQKNVVEKIFGKDEKEIHIETRISLPSSTEVICGSSSVAYAFVGANTYVTMKRINAKYQANVKLYKHTCTKRDILRRTLTDEHVVNDLAISAIRLLGIFSHYLIPACHGGASISVSAHVGGYAFGYLFVKGLEKYGFF
jgi:membrane associated rhomboid family serine protease